MTDICPYYRSSPYRIFILLMRCEIWSRMWLRYIIGSIWYLWWHWNKGKRGHFLSRPLPVLFLILYDLRIFFCLGLASLANWRYLSFQYSNVKIEKLLKTPFSPINCLTNTKKCLSNVYQIAKKNRRTFKLAVKHLFDYWSYVRLERFFYSRVIREGDKYYCLHHTCNCVRERSRRNPKVLALYLPPNRLSGRY